MLSTHSVRFGLRRDVCALAVGQDQLGGAPAVPRFGDSHQLAVIGYAGVYETGSWAEMQLLKLWPCDVDVRT